MCIGYGNRSFFSLLLIGLMLLLTLPVDLQAGGKVGIYGIRMVPRGDDAENFSRPGWGGGVHVVAPIRQIDNLFAPTAGFEIINLLNQTYVFIDDFTGLRTEQQTSQNYFRLYAGGQVGGHGNGFIRPHAGLNLALAIYSINTDVVIPDDYDPDNEIRQKKYSETKAAFGYDITLGIDLNFSGGIALDGGVRYVKSFNVPQQLGLDDSEKIHPQYFQVYLGIGVSFGMLSKMDED